MKRRKRCIRASIGLISWDFSSKMSWFDGVLQLPGGWRFARPGVLITASGLHDCSGVTCGERLLKRET